MTTKFHVGQKVALTANLSDIPHPRVVVSVSASGRVKLAGDDRTFNPNGVLRGRGKWDNTAIQPWAPYHGAKRYSAIVNTLRRDITVGLLSDATDAELTDALVAALAVRKAK